MAGEKFEYNQVKNALNWNMKKCVKLKWWRKNALNWNDEKSGKMKWWNKCGKLKG